MKDDFLDRTISLNVSSWSCSGIVLSRKGFQISPSVEQQKRKGLSSHRSVAYAAPFAVLTGPVFALTMAEDPLAMAARSSIWEIPAYSSARLLGEVGTWE